jgi:hypothetical protein
MENPLGDVLYALNAPYRSVVTAVNTAVQPVLYRITENYLQDAITRNHAETNPRLKQFLTFEIERRGYGAGQTQDVAEPIVWQGIKMAAALSLPPITKALEHAIDGTHSTQAAWISKGVAAGIIVKESLDFFRLIGRYTSGLQGSEQMALKREQEVLKTGKDPFSLYANHPSSQISEPSTHIAPTQTPCPSTER